MHIRTIILTTAVAVAAPLSGCSSSSPAPHRTGGLPPGTVEVTVDGRQLATSKRVDCTSIGSMTTITTGDEASGATVVVDDDATLDAKSVAIRSLGGFTGSYWQNLGDEATVKLDGGTYAVVGTAEGFNDADPSRRTQATFVIDASC